MPKKKRKPYTMSEERLKAHDKMTKWSQRASIYSMRYDQKISVIEIAKFLKITRGRVYQILEDVKTRIKPE